MGDNTYGELGDGTYGISPYFATNRPEMILSNNVTAIAGGYFHTLLLKSDGSLWAMGFNQYGQLGDGTVNQTNRPELIVSAPPSYIISAQLLSGGNVQLSFAGIAGTNYALDRSFSLSPPNWVPQVTNPAGAGRVLLFTNTPNAVTNNFWRIRSVP
jgi:alpha-tubulin suppressor-like RCC1 family protein